MRPGFGVLLIATLAIGLAFLTGAYAFSRYLNQSVATGSGTLRLVTSALDGHLARYEALPTLIAEQGEVRDVLLRPRDPATQRRANLYLQSVNKLLAASDVYVMLPAGETVAASNFDGPRSFVGENFRYRPYFQAAAEGRRGRFFGLGTTSNKRGYYFSAPVRLDGRVAGIVVFKVDLDPIEASWGRGNFEILVVDPEGIVFMAGRPEWRFRAFERVGPAARSRSQTMRRYAEQEVPELGAVLRQGSEKHLLAHIEAKGMPRDFVVLRQTIADAGWTVTVLVDTAPARALAVVVGLATLFLVVLGGIALAALRQRRLRLVERQRHQAEEHDKLERRVGERTAALAVANVQLEREVAERRLTEDTLRQTQSDLIEAGKLAALGQMSAALSHEFNQPLAAVSAYADSATVLIDRGRAAEARENVLRIASLVDRLSTISRHLRTFARRPDEELRTVDVRGAIAAALEIVDWRLRAAEAGVETRVAPAIGSVLAGDVRLQQILVNLVSNAADAVEGRQDRRIAIIAEPDGETGVRIAVCDSGPGVPDAIAARIFDPFFTTKGIGKGLGLGLSISYNIARDFGGTLLFERDDEGGSMFVLRLRRACAVAAAAE